MLIVHATCVAHAGRAVLLCGPSGSGKSDLALRLIDGGAELVADDQVVLRDDDGRLFASPPAALAGRMEVRGIGIVAVVHAASAPVVLAVDLVAPAAVERLPEPAFRTWLGHPVPLIALAPFEASAPAKIRIALAHFANR